MKMKAPLIKEIRRGEHTGYYERSIEGGGKETEIKCNLVNCWSSLFRGPGWEKEPLKGKEGQTWVGL